MQSSNLLAQVREGMDVYDLDGDKVGSVAEVFLGAASDEVEAYTSDSSAVPDPDVYRKDSFVEDIAEVLGGGADLPEAVRARLLSHGYIRIGGGLFQSTRYAMAEQVASVSDEGVRLTIDGDNLIS